MSAHPPGAPAGAPNPAAEVKDYVESMQSDGRLLLRFVARRVDRALPSGAPGEAPAKAPTAEPPAPPPAEGAGDAGGVCPGFEALFAPSDVILKTPALLSALLRCVDELSRRAAPANVRSIRLTSAFLRIAVEGNEPPRSVAKEANRLRWAIFLVTGAAMLLLPAAIGLLAHVDNGRRLLQQLEITRAQEQDVQRDLLALPLAETQVQGIEVELRDGLPPVVVAQAAPLQLPADSNGGLQPCGRPPHTESAGGLIVTDARAAAPMPSMPGRSLVLWREPITQKALAICRRYDDNRVRLDIIYTGLADWNCLTHKIFSFYALERLLGRSFNVWLWGRPTLACGEPTVPMPPEIQLTTWQSHETWVSATTAVVAGFILPLLLGCLGGCTYALRRVDRKISSWSLEPHDGRHALSRVALSALLGGLVGVFWTSGTPVSLGGFTLSLAAVAFFVGFSVEGVFKLIEALIGKTIGSLTKSSDSPDAPPKSG